MNLLTAKCLYISSKLKENKQLYYIYPLFFLFPLPLGLSEKDFKNHYCIYMILNNYFEITLHLSDNITLIKYNTNYMLKILYTFF